jgi:hypothetical protein
VNVDRGHFGVFLLLRRLEQLPLGGGDGVAVELGIIK